MEGKIWKLILSEIEEDNLIAEELLELNPMMKKKLQIIQDYLGPRSGINTDEFFRKYHTDPYKGSYRVYNQIHSIGISNDFKDVKSSPKPKRVINIIKKWEEE